MTSTCPNCNGLGYDKEATESAKAKRLIDSGTIRCHYCNGNGWDPWVKFLDCLQTKEKTGQ